MKRLKLLALLPGLCALYLKAQTCTLYISNDHPQTGETVSLLPEFKGLKSRTKIKIDYYLFDSLIHSDHKASEFSFTPTHDGRFEFSAVLEYSRKGKIYKLDTIGFEIISSSQKAWINLFQNPIKLYHNVPFIFEVNALNVDVGDLLLTFTQCTAQKIELIKYEIIAQKLRMSDTAVIYLSARNGDSFHILNLYKIPILEVPKPTITVLFQGLSSDSALMLNPVPDGPYEYTYTGGVSSFTIRYTLNGKTVTHLVKGSVPTPEIMKDIRTLPSDTWIYFEDITYWIKYSETTTVWMSSNTAFKLP